MYCGTILLFNPVTKPVINLLKRRTQIFVTWLKQVARIPIKSVIKSAVFLEEISNNLPDIKEPIIAPKGTLAVKREFIIDLFSGDTLKTAIIVSLANERTPIE